MTHSLSGATRLADGVAALDAEFALDVRVVETARPVGNLMFDTSDGCGATCENACVSFTGDPS